MRYETLKTIESLDSIERQIAAGRNSLNKELIFNRVRVLCCEGYASDVALAMAMKEHNFTTAN